MKNENFVIITFQLQDEAIKASHNLQDLAIRGDIELKYSIMLRKNNEGKVEVLKKETKDGIESWTGMFIGMLTGMFFGPLGFLISTLAGTAIGAGLDSSHEKFNDNFVDTVKEKLGEGNIAIIANVNESSDVFINDSLKEFDCNIYRTIISE